MSSPAMALTPYAVEAAFFEICPSKFFEQVYELCDGLINEGVTALEEKLMEEVEEDQKQLVRTACTGMLDKFQKSIDANLDKLEMYSLLNIFNVPPSVYVKWTGAQREATRGTDNRSTELDEEVARSFRLAAGSLHQPVSLEAEAEAEGRLRAARKKLRQAKRRQALLAGRKRDLAGARAVLEGDAKAALKAYGSTPGPSGERALGNPQAVAVMVAGIVKKAQAVQRQLAEAKAALGTEQAGTRSAEAEGGAELGVGRRSRAAAGESAESPASVMRAQKRTLGVAEGPANAGSPPAAFSRAGSAAASLRNLNKRLAS